MKALYPMALLAAFVSIDVYAACTQPMPPRNIPRGKSATHEQMLAAHKTVKDFDTATNAYVSCLQEEGDAEVAKLAQAEGNPKKKEKQIKKLMSALVKKQNAAFDADKALAARFNEQLKIFKAKNNEQS